MTKLTLAGRDTDFFITRSSILIHTQGPQRRNRRRPNQLTVAKDLDIADVDDETSRVAEGRAPSLLSKR